MDAMTTRIDHLVALIAKSLVDYPQEVAVTMIEGTNTVVLELRVAKEDMSKVIGRQGGTVQAMRTLIGAVAGKINKRTVLEILE